MFVICLMSQCMASVIDTAQVTYKGSIIEGYMVYVW